MSSNSPVTVAFRKCISTHPIQQEFGQHLVRIFLIMLQQCNAYPWCLLRWYMLLVSFPQYTQNIVRQFPFHSSSDLTVPTSFCFICSKSLQRSFIQTRIKVMRMQNVSFKRFNELMRYLMSVQCVVLIPNLKVCWFCEF